MRVSRLMFALWVGLSILVSIVIVETAGCRQGGTQPGFAAHGYRSLKCEKDVTVTLDPKYKNGVDKNAFYVCEDEPNVTWSKGTGVNTFTIVFQGTCPFTSCQITDSNPTATLAPLPADLTVYKYTLTINSNQTFDPQVVSGGGHHL